MSQRTHLIVLASITAAACGGGGDGDVPAGVPVRTPVAAQTVNSGGVGTAAGGGIDLVPQAALPSGGGSAADWDSSASAEEVFSVTKTLQVGQRYYHGFSISGSAADLELLYVSRYTADFYLMPQDQAQAFLDGRTFTYLTNRTPPAGTNGFKILTALAPGSYAVGVVNRANVPTTVRVELQRQAAVQGFRYAGDRFTPAIVNTQPGTRWTQTVSLGDSYRTVVDGANTGGTVYLIPESQVSNFRSGASFLYITNHSCGGGTPAPGFCELRFASGKYAIAYVNDTSEPQTILVYGRDFVPR